MSVDAFLDTNVLIYAVMEDGTAPEKTARARELLLSKRWAWSVQVAQEFYVNTTKAKKGITPLSHEEILLWLNAWDNMPMQENTKGCLSLALEIKQRYKISLWDANILAAANLIGAPILLSEDLSHDQVYQGVRVMNPFHSLL